MLNWLRMHWFEVGIFLSFPIFAYLATNKVSEISFILWISLITLFIHQLEEYRYPGYFPGMINVAMYKSSTPDRYPFNLNTAFIVNTTVGWFFFFIAAMFSESLIWLGIATILVSVGNVIAHTFLFNIKGKTKYNPGMVTALILFLPLTFFFFYILITKNLASPLDYVLGIILGFILNYIGILKLIDWLKDENTSYIFPKRCLIPSMRD